MNDTLVSVESDSIRVEPSLANMLACIRLGARIASNGQAYFFPATTDYARLLRVALRNIQTTPEFDALISGTGASFPRSSHGRGGPSVPAPVVVPEPKILPPAGYLNPSSLPVAAPEGRIQVLPRPVRGGHARHPPGDGHGHGQESRGMHAPAGAPRAPRQSKKPPVPLCSAPCA